MNRRQFLTLGAVASGTFAVRGLSRMGSGPVASAPPTVGPARAHQRGGSPKSSRICRRSPPRDESMW